MTTVLCEDKVREQLKQVIDPELFVNIVDLGLIYVVDLEPSPEEPEKTNVKVEMTLTSPMCSGRSATGREQPSSNRVARRRRLGGHQSRHGSAMDAGSYDR